MTNPDPETVSWLRLVLACMTVFGLLALLGCGLRYIGRSGFKMPGIKPRSARLKLIESLSLDVRRRLVIVACDGHEHLLLLGVNQDIVVETNLAAPAAVPETTSAT